MTQCHQVPVNAGSYTVVGTITDTNHAGSSTDTLTIYNPANALVSSWPATITNTTILTSTNMTAWSALGTYIGPTNQLVIAKNAGNQFFLGPNLNIIDTSP